MKRITALALIALLTLAGGMLLSGCATAEEEDSALPWATPKTWENQVPGMPAPYEN